MPADTSVLPGGRHRRSAQPRTLLGRRASASWIAMVLALVAAAPVTTTLTSAAPAEAATTMIIGSAGDAAELARKTGERMAVHTYRTFSNNVPTGVRSLTVRVPNASWRQVANAQPGSAIYNDIVRWARTIKTRGPIQVAYHHEPETKHSTQFGSQADFIAAYRRVVTIFNGQGATNVEWVWQMTAYSFKVSPSDRRYYAKWYPGDAWVDNVGVDGYNAGTCDGRNEWRKMADFANPVVAFAKAHGKKVSLQEFAAPADSRRAAWLRDVHQYLAANKNVINAAYYFHYSPANPSMTHCSWKLTTAAEFDAYGDIARDTANFRSA